MKYQRLTSLLGRALLLGTFLTLAQCRNPSAEVHVTQGASLGGYELVRILPADAWIANHSITRLFAQEFERRGYAVHIGETEKIAGRRTVSLHITQAAAAINETVETLGDLDIRLVDPATKKVLATAFYKGWTLDPIGQRELVRSTVDELLAKAP